MQAVNFIFFFINIIYSVVFFGWGNMRISIHSRRFDFSIADLRKITIKYKAKYKKGPDGLLPIKTTIGNKNGKEKYGQ
jgi:hypothetical protein